MVRRIPWLGLACILMSIGVVLACGDSAEPGSSADTQNPPDIIPADAVPDVADVPFVDETSDGIEPDGSPPPPDIPQPIDVPDPKDPCDLVDCPAGAVCVIDADETPACFMEAQIVETFDTQDHMAANTKASWGNGTLSSGTGGLVGDGSDGAFEPTEDVTVDTTDKMVFQYTTFNIPTGVTVTVVGENPWDVKVQDTVTIDGWIRSDGAPGVHACKKPDGSGGQVGGVALAGGTGGAGGGAGGDGGAGYAEFGQPGGGAGGGHPSTVASGKTASLGSVAGGGGGGYGSPGEDGVAMVSGGGFGLGGVTYGALDIPTLVGGSGGGGGAGRDAGGNDGSCGPDCSSNQMNCYQGNCQGQKPSKGDEVLNEFDTPGASGGGGGGGIGIESGANVTIRGGISVDGGNGGWGSSSGGGGGGSGGTIRLEAWSEVTLAGGILSARGGRGGVLSCGNINPAKKAGHGGDGRIQVVSMSGLTQGYLVNPDPPPSIDGIEATLDGGTGALGVFAPTEDVVLNTDAGPYEYLTFELPPGVTLRAEGTVPLVIRAASHISIFGDIDLSGLQGDTGYSACCGNPYPTAHSGVGGSPGAGGYAGGIGGEGGPGMPGEGPGGSPGGPIGVFSSAGGAGFAQVGQSGGTNSCKSAGPVGGSVNGDATLTDLYGGSGGGGAGDGRAAACTWCLDGTCMIAGNPASDCPDKATCGGYCISVKNACADVVGCWATEKWNPGSGGGGGGGALHLETPGLVRIDGAVRLNGGDGGDSVGSHNYNDGSCAESCKGACLDGICYSDSDGTCDESCPSYAGCIQGVCYKKGGSFGGSGGGGSGGGLLIRSAGLRADGVLEARGGQSGTLSQGGGCQVDPDDANPLPGQGRGGMGSPGRIRIETQSSTGSILIQKGTFHRVALQPVFGTYAQSLWYALDSDDSVLTQVDVVGGSPIDVVNVQMAPADADGQVDGDNASTWAVDPKTLPAGAFVRFRVHLAEPTDSNPGSVVDEMTFHYRYPVQ